MTTFYHFYCEGFEKQARTIKELQIKIDALKKTVNIKGNTFVVYRIENNSIASERRGICT